MTNPPQTAAPENERFGTLSLLRLQHSDLLKRFLSAQVPAQMGAEIEDFVLKGSRTGAVLDAEKDRAAAQNLIDYWTTVLIRMDHPVMVPPLADFDIRLAPILADEQCPYRGLEAFQEENSAYFFGRRNLVEELVGVLGRARLVCVLGPSGSGKSSLVRAGLLPRLRGGAVDGSQDWLVLPVMVPGADPIANLTAALGAGNQAVVQPEDAAEISRRLLDDPGEVLRQIGQRFPAKPILLVVDQFEEVFTLCTSAAQRQAFVKCLLEIVACPEPAHHLVLTMRADFNANLASLPELQPLVEKTRVNITPLTSAELRDAIELPAKTVGLRIDEEVVNELVIEVLGDPSALPLLQFTLLKLWENREHNLVTWQAYRKIGGGRQALAKTADDLYQNLTDEKKQTLKRVLLGMVRPGEGVEITSNRVQRKTLYQSGEDAERIDFVLEALIKSGLVRASGGSGPEATVEVAHEALIRNWPTLADWLETERVELRKRQRLAALAEQWNTARDAGLLLRGLPLQEALRYEDLNDLETLFVNASLDQESQEAVEREAQQRRELEAATRLAESEKTRADETARAANRLRRQAGVLYAGLVLLVLASLFAMWGWDSSGQNAALARIQAVTAESGRQQAQLAQQVAVQYQNTAQVGLTTSQAIEKTAVSAGQEAERQRQLAETQSQKEEVQRKLAEAQSLLARSRELASQALNTLRTSPVLGQLLAVEAFRTSDTAESRSALLSSVQIGLSNSYDNPVVFSVLDPPIETGDSFVQTVAFSLDGALIASGNNNGVVKIWSFDTHQLSTYKQPARVAGRIFSVAFHPKDNLLAFGGASKEAIVWDYIRGQVVFRMEAPFWITRVAYSPTGDRLAVASYGGRVYVYSVPEYRLIRDIFLQANLPLYTLSWSPDGKFLLAGDLRIHILDLEKTGEIQTMGIYHSDAIWGLAWSEKQNAIFSAAKDGQLVRWDLKTSTPNGINSGQGKIYGLALTPDGQLVATAGANGTVAIWNAQTLEKITVLEGRTFVAEVAFNNQGTVLAASNLDGSLLFWKLEHQEVFGQRLQASGPPVKSFSLDANGDLLFAGPGFSGFQLVGKAQLSNQGRGTVLYASGLQAGKKILFAANLDGSIAKLDGESGAPAGPTVQTAGFGIQALAIDPGKNRLLASVCTSQADDSSCAMTEIHAYALDDLKDQGVIGSTAGIITSMAFAPRSNLDAFGDENGGISVQQFDPQGQTKMLFFSYPSAVLSLAISPDGQTLASGHKDGSILLWDLTSGQQLGQPFLGSLKSISALIFTPDGKTLVSGSQDGIVMAWDVDPQSWAKRACQKAGRNLTGQEWDQYMKDIPFRNTCVINP